MLTTRQASALLLRKRGLTDAEVGLVLGIRRDSVSKLLSRARATVDRLGLPPELQTDVAAIAGQTSAPRKPSPSKLSK